MTRGVCVLGVSVRGYMSRGVLSCHRIGSSNRGPLMGVSYVRSSDCSGVFGQLFGANAHARIAKMEHSAIQPCRENRNNLKLGAN